jgi:hypothetical protein
MLKNQNGAIDNTTYNIPNNIRTLKALHKKDFREINASYFQSY